MIHRTAIIDIGSNSARLVIFEKTSPYGFHLICEQKSKVRIGEGAYNQKGYLQPIGIKRAYLALKSFLNTIEKYQANKILCVATSALRDAPNAQKFTAWIQENLGLDINIIDGEEEAMYGALAAINLLPTQQKFITIDIGGGSSDLALIHKNKIVATYSLNLGTVRLKELFFDSARKNRDNHQNAKHYIQQELNHLPKHFKTTLAIGIGGTARTLSKAIMKHTSYPLDKLHAFSYTLDNHVDYLHAITQSSAKNLKAFELKKNRYDTIREGTLIFTQILSYIGAETVVSSAVGVREGVYLNYLLKDYQFQFPKNINPSIHSILDRFKPQITIEKKRKVKYKIASALYQLFHPYIGDKADYEKSLYTALELSSIGKTLTIYKSHQHAFYIAMQELNYGFSHEESLLISLLLRMHGKELVNQTLYKQYQSLLPTIEVLQWLSFIYTLTVFLHEASNVAKFRFTFKNKTLIIHANTPLYLAKERIKNLEKPFAFAIMIKDKIKLPKCKALKI